MKTHFSIVKKAYLWFIVAACATVISRVLFMMNAQFSEEFTGGVNLTFKGTVNAQELSEGLSDFLVDQGFPKMQLLLEQSSQQTEIKINAKLDDDSKVNQLSALIPLYLEQEQYITSDADIIDQAIIGPSVGAYMKDTAMKALGFWILAMVIYMIFSFGTIRKQIAPSILAIVVVMATVLSISIPAGAYGLWMMFNSTIQIDTVFIIAILTVIGYGINDVIIIFDRVRENMLAHGEKKGVNLMHIFDESIWQTMKRSVGTSFSTLLVLIAMMVFGSGVLATFAFTVGIGVIAATLSSIFVAVPAAYILLTLWNRKK